MCVRTVDMEVTYKSIKSYRVEFTLILGMNEHVIFQAFSQNKICARKTKLGICLGIFCMMTSWPLLLKVAAFALTINGISRCTDFLRAAIGRSSALVSPHEKTHFRSKLFDKFSKSMHQLHQIRSNGGQGTLHKNEYSSWIYLFFGSTGKWSKLRQSVR